jgi:hypothetical protein
LESAIPEGDLNSLGFAFSLPKSIAKKGIRAASFVFRLSLFSCSGRLGRWGPRQRFGQKAEPRIGLGATSLWTEGQQVERRTEGGGRGFGSLQFFVFISLVLILLISSFFEIHSSV